MRVGVKFCGNCNPVVDTVKVLKSVKELLSGVEFVKAGLGDQDEVVDVILSLSGCSVGCASKEGREAAVIAVAGERVDWESCPVDVLPRRIVQCILQWEAKTRGERVMEEDRKRTDKRMSLKEAISRFVHDGCSIAFSGMGGAQCVAHTYEIIRQGKKNLTLIGDSPCESGDMLVGAGCVKRMEIAWCSYAVAGLGYNFRRAIEKGVPNNVELEEYSNYTMGLRFLAGAMNIPYMPTRSLLGSDIVKYNPRIKIVDDPYGSGKVALVPAALPDVGIVHVSRADKRGNAQVFGFSSNAENIARAAKCTIVTCEEIVSTEEIRKTGNLTIIPEYCVDAVVELPFACHPWNMPYAYAYDMPFHTFQLAQFRTRDGFLKWLEEWCYGIEDHEGYCEKVGWERLLELKRIENKFCQVPYAG